jgi:D-beta-D-heptose 7-phosphate kinase/D-beta-D-heptose 1-phosphate adenosyltransferase
MATIVANGCFDLLHDGHRRFLRAARKAGGSDDVNHLIVAINSDESAIALKGSKWGEKYPIMKAHERAMALRDYADQVLIFENEKQLHDIIEFVSPCIIAKGPDYAGRETDVTGSDIAPVLILDTPETEEIRELKRKTYML